jgi:hypothetical protein
MKSRALAVVGLIALCAAGVRAGVTTVDFSGDYSQHHLTHFDGVATYDSGTGKLNIAVTNRTAHGGFLTGIALSAAGPTLSLADTAGGFTDARNHGGIVKSGPLGKYHAGATTGINWSAGGRAAHGVAAGSSHLFTFQTDAADANSLTVDDFLTPGKTGEEIVARFRKIPHHGYDRGGAVTSGPVGELFASQFEPVIETGLVVLDNTTISSGPTPQVTTAAVPLPRAVWMALVTLLLVPVIRPLYRKKRIC